MKYGYFRRPHLLYRNKTTKVPTRFNVIACSYWKHVNKKNPSGCFYTLRHVCVQYWTNGENGWDCDTPDVFDDAERFWSFLNDTSDPARNNYLVSANLATDLSVLAYSQAIKDGMICDKFAIINNPPTIVEWENHGGRKTIAVDLRNFLSAYTKTIISEEPSELASFEVNASNVADRQSVINQCELSGIAFCKYLNWIVDNDLGTWQQTTGAQAMSAYSHRFMDKNIFVHGHSEVCKLERQSFKGGRCEAFYYGDYRGRVYNVDVNGLYPYIMRNFKFPHQCIEHEKFPSLSNPIFGRADIGIIARVHLNTKNNAYPTVINGRSVYATGQFTTVLAEAEFRQAWKNNEIESIGEYSAYLTDYIFVRFINYFDNLRRQYKLKDNNIYAHMCKEFMVKLFGKFAQKETAWIEDETEWRMEEQGIWPVINAETGQIKIVRSFADKVEYQVKDGETDNSFPAISSFVTSYARIYMNEIRRAAGSKNVLLQYVDSILLTEEGIKSIDDLIKDNNGPLGSLRLEGVYDGAEIWSAWDYRIGSVEKICGIPPEASVSHDGYIIYDVEDAQGSLLSDSGDGSYHICKISGRLLRRKPVNYTGQEGWLEPIVINE